MSEVTGFDAGVVKHPDHSIKHIPVAREKLIYVFLYFILTEMMRNLGRTYGNYSGHILAPDFITKLKMN
jgi:hypothetical protein